MASSAVTEKATFGAGCFWGVEARFAALPGVVDTAAGYAGGSLTEPTYGEVCAGGTGHAEVVEVTFKPVRIAYSTLLEAFFEMHNPAQPYLVEKPESQYRSMILAYSEEQAAEARKRIEALNASGKYASPVKTRVMTEGQFWRAEENHQRYFEKRNLKPDSA